jgi:hypothetical protein
MATKKRRAAIAPRVDVLEPRLLLSIGVGPYHVSPFNFGTDQETYVVPAHQSSLDGDEGGAGRVPLDPSGAGTSDPVAGEFPGISNTGWIPPDDNLAVGPTRVIEAANEQIDFFNKDGSAALTGGTNVLALTTLFPGSLDGSIFDPRIAYDPANGGHFLLIAAERSSSGTDASSLDIATSIDSSPGASTSSWRTYRVDVMSIVAGKDYWLDFPGLGYDDTALYVTGNMFAFSKGYLGAELLTFDKNALETGTYPGTGTPKLIAPANTQVITDGFSLQPAVTHGKSSAEYLIEAWDTTSVRLHAVTNPLASGGLTRTSTLVTVPAYGLSVPDAPQLGSSKLIAANDTRFLNAVVMSGSLWSAHTFENTSNGQDKASVRWYQFSTNAWPTSGGPSLAKSATIDPGSGVSTFFPSIAVDANGDVAVGYSQSSASTYPSAYLTTYPARSASSATSAIHLGQAAYNVTPNRWGDYSGTVADPTTPGLFWSVGAATTSSGNWGTWFVQAPVAYDQLSVSSPTAVVSGTNLSITVTARDPGGGVDPGYTGTVHFTSSDGLAILPPDYTFTPGDAGTHTFTGALRTVGTQSITATDTAVGSINGTQASIQVGGAPWTGYAGNPQHTALSTVESQSLDTIAWSTPVDLNPQFSGNDLLIHYGTPLVTAANTVLVPVKTGATDGFMVKAVDGRTGGVKWTQATDYTLPPHDWTPSYGPALTPANRLYFAGAGGTVYYINSPDATGASTSGQLAFYGIGNYSHAAYDSTVFIDTPLTVDRAGNLYFGFVVTGPNPLNLQSGIARIDPNGNGTWVAAGTAAGGNGITQVAQNCAPALSNDGSLVYIAVSSGSQGSGYLVALNSTTLAPVSRVALNDPGSGMPAYLFDISTASPTVGPDGDVYFGVIEDPFPSNHDRGWLLHFSGDLATLKTPGAFGWDDTASVVPASTVPSYHGSSTYLLMTKYNNYAGLGGDGVNRIAILDPNDQEVDPVTGARVMEEVLTIAGPTPDAGATASYPNAVREWCINTAVVDPFSRSIMVNSEDGILYRWDLTTNTFTQRITLTPGVGEAYTPTVIGIDGTVYAINNATLFAVKRVQPSATFVKSDAATQGSWKGAYGGDGFDLSQDPGPNNPAPPAYAALSLAGAQAYTWTASTSDPRALQRAAPGSTDRIAAAWYSATAFTVDLAISDAQAHRLALYALDYDGYGGGRSERIDLIDRASGAVLDSRTLGGFGGGAYLVWDVKGSVTIRVTNLNPNSNALLNGLFLG